MNESRWYPMADMGFEDGWDAAMAEVNALMHELYAAQKPEVAASINELVWTRLQEKQVAAMAERLAKRAVRDQYAAEIVARDTSTPDEVLGAGVPDPDDDAAWAARDRLYAKATENDRPEPDSYGNR